MTDFITGAIVTVAGYVTSTVNKSSDIDKHYPPNENDIIPAKYDGAWPTAHLYRYLVMNFYENAISALVLGWTTRNVGEIYPPTNQYDEWGKLENVDSGGMIVDESYLVWVVMPLGKANRYRKPVAVLPEQIWENDI